MNRWIAFAALIPAGAIVMCSCDVTAPDPVSDQLSEPFEDRPGEYLIGDVYTAEATFGMPTYAWMGDEAIAYLGREGAYVMKINLSPRKVTILNGRESGFRHRMIRTTKDDENDWVYFDSYALDGSYDEMLYRVAGSGGEAESLGAFSFSGFAVSPDGSQLVIDHYTSGDERLLRYHDGGWSALGVEEGGFPLAISPDLSEVIVASPGMHFPSSLQAISLSSGARRTLWTDAATTGYLQDLRFGSSGVELLFMTVLSATAHIYKYEEATGVSRVIASLEATPDLGFEFGASWSPDGSHVAAWIPKKCQSSPPAWRLCERQHYMLLLIDVATGSTTTVAQGTFNAVAAPTISPGGDALTYLADGLLYLVEL